jgi:hypothetical protein
MINEILTNKWINFPWLPGQGMDNLIHPADLELLQEQGMGIGLVLCMEDEGEYLKVRYKSNVLRVKKTGVKNVYPSPAFTWGQKVTIKNKQITDCEIEDVIWHHNEMRYFYRLKVENKINKRRYFEEDITVTM